MVLFPASTCPTTTKLALFFPLCFSNSEMTSRLRLLGSGASALGSSAPASLLPAAGAVFLALGPGVAFCPAVVAISNCC
jgi:hypothetical protein